MTKVHIKNQSVSWRRWMTVCLQDISVCKDTVIRHCDQWSVISDQWSSSKKTKQSAHALSSRCRDRMQWSKWKCCRSTGPATAVWFLGCFWMFSRSSLTGVVKQCSDQCRSWDHILQYLSNDHRQVGEELWMFNPWSQSWYVRFKLFRLSMGYGHRESSNGLVDIHLFKVKNTNENMWFWKFQRPPTSVFTYQTTNHNQASNQASHVAREDWEVPRVPFGAPSVWRFQSRAKACLLIGSHHGMSEKADCGACGEIGTMVTMALWQSWSSKGLGTVNPNNHKHGSHIISWKMEAHGILRESTLLVICEGSGSFLQNMRPVILLKFSSHWTESLIRVWQFDMCLIC